MKIVTIREITTSSKKTLDGGLYSSVFVVITLVLNDTVNRVHGKYFMWSAINSNKYHRAEAGNMSINSFIGL